MKYLRTHKVEELDESWFSSYKNNNSDPIKNYLQNKVDELKNTTITITSTTNLDYKFFNYIAGQLIESRIRVYLGLEDTKILDGTYNYNGKKVNLEVKAFYKNKQSAAKSMFTNGEKEYIHNNQNISYGVLCSYIIDKPKNILDNLTYKIDDIFVLSGDELIKHI